MFYKKRLLFITLTVLIVIAVMALAAGMNAVDFQEGRAFWVRGEPNSISSLSIPAGGQGSESLAKFFGFMGAALTFLLPIGIVLMIIDPEQRKKVLSTIIQVIVFVMVAMFLSYMLREGAPIDVLQEEVVEAPIVGSSQLGTAGFTSDFVAPTSIADAPEWVVLFASGIAAVILYYSGRYVYLRYLQPTPLQQLGEDARGTLQNLRTGADVNDAIRKCYYEMSDTLRREHSIRRNQAMTTREFEELLQKSGIPNTYIRDLTRLFEKVRYGAKSPSESDERQAIECLTAIVEAASMGGSA